MAGKIIIGKSVNSNLGHSGGKYGMWIARNGEEDITSCSKDELIFSTDTFGNASGAIGIGQYQVMPSSGSTAEQTVSVSAGSSATVSWTDLNIDLIWALNIGLGIGGGGNMASATDDSFQNAQAYGTNQSSTTINNTGSAARTTRVVAVRGFKTGGLY